jgi:hypothetical protein
MLTTGEEAGERWVVLKLLVSFPIRLLRLSVSE